MQVVRSYIGSFLASSSKIIMSPEQARAILERGENLPDNLTIDGFLNLGGCTSLSSLPDNLNIGGSLDN